MGNARKQGKKNASVWLNEFYQEIVDSLKGSLNLNQSQIIKVAMRLLKDPSRDVSVIVSEVLEEESKEKGI